MKVSSFAFLSSLFVVSWALPSAVEDESIAKKLEVLSRVKRVIGGEEVETGDWPWLVHLKGKFPRHGWFSRVIGTYDYAYCGGALLDTNHVLTSAHCFDGDDKKKTPKHWHIKAGDAEAHTHVYDSLVSFFGGLFGRQDMITHTSHAAKITTHPQYNPGNMWDYDAAIIETAENFAVDDPDVPIGAVPMPPSSMGSDWPAIGEECVMKGWGCKEAGGDRQDIARAVEMPRIADTQCANMYAASTVARFCAGHSMRSMGICSGDSGGPLVCRINGTWAQAGIASFAAMTGPGDHPAGFTRVTKILPFIMDNLPGKK